MVTQFKFIGFTPNEFIKSEVNGVLDHIKNRAPTLSTIVGKLEYLGTSYVCSIDVFLKQGTAFTRITDVDAVQALRYAEKSIINKLPRQKDTSFYTRDGSKDL